MLLRRPDAVCTWSCVAPRSEGLHAIPRGTLEAAHSLDSL